MAMRRFLPLLLALGLCLAGVTWALSMRKSATVKPRPLPVVQRKPYDPQLVHLNVQFWASQVRSDPQSAISLASLAHSYLDSYRESGDIADAVRAEQMARRSLAVRSRNNYDALMQLARSLETQHRFSEALQLATRGAAYSAGANRQIADLQIELGDYAAARRALAKAPAQAKDPAYDALRARLLEIAGKNAAALELWQRAARQAEADLDMSPQNVAWFLEREGHCLAGIGRLDEAEQAYRKALEIFPPDYRTLFALARLSAARRDWKTTLQWGQKAAAIVPNPETVALMGDAYAALGNAKAAQGQYQLVEAMAKIDRARGALYDRQRALFYAEHKRNLDEAVTLARGELKVRRDIYAYDTLAWVCYHKGLLPEARRAIDRALAHGTQDAALFYHAGMIAAAQGESDLARKHLERALQINPYFHPSGVQQARDLLARLGDTPGHDALK